MDRNNFSVRRVTNIKKTTVWERLHKIHNYHWYTQYKMATEAISDISSDEDVEVECLDTKPDGFHSEEESQESEEEDSSESEEEDSSESEEEDSSESEEEDSESEEADSD